MYHPLGFGFATARAPLPPGVVPTRGHPHHSTQNPYLIVGLLLVYEPKSQLFSFAKKATAFFKISRSISASRRFFCKRRISSSGFACPPAGTAARSTQLVNDPPDIPNCLAVPLTFPPFRSNSSKGTVKLTDLSAYSAPCPLPKLLILRSTDDRFRLQNPRIPLNLTVLPHGFPFRRPHSHFPIHWMRLSEIV